MLNSCEFIGNLGADPEIRSFQNGGKVANLRLAVTEKYKDRDGNRQEHTDWIPIAIFNEGLVGVAEQYLRKGAKVYIRGSFKTRKYSAQDGTDRYSTECVLRGFDAKLVMLDSPNGERREQQQTDNGSGWGAALDDDSDVPF